MADYDFRLLHGRQLRGSGWRGLVALALLLAAYVITAWLLEQRAQDALVISCAIQATQAGAERVGAGIG
jgi:hypothetical protein